MCARKALYRFSAALLVALALPVGVWSQQRENLAADLDVSAQLQGSAASGVTPLWLNANKYGLSSLEEFNGYLRVSALRPAAADSARRWRWGYGADVAVAAGYTSVCVVQQAFAEIAWGYGLLTVGSKEEPAQLKNARLSSGSQTLGTNARPVPQVRLSLPDYWSVPGTRRWLSIKGHIAYGRFTDDRWQRSFTAAARAAALAAGENSDERRGRYCEDVLYHSKALFFRIGESGALRHFSLEFGAEAACQFGGTMHYVSSGGEELAVKTKTGFSSYIHALAFGGQDARDGDYPNTEGNQLGSYIIKLNYKSAAVDAAVYIDHFFEDLSGMAFVSYDGYGAGDEWNVRTEHKYYRFPLKDFMLGAEVNIKRWHWVRNIVVEYLYTKYQSGPYNHDHTANITDHIDGQDEYYNHSIYNSWQHWGQVMGNPLYLSPIYNADGVIVVGNNRFTALHVGVDGTLVSALAYRLLATYQAGWGTYQYPYTHRQSCFSGLLEAEYTVSPSWRLTAAVALDHGEIRGNNVGAQLTARYTIWHGQGYKH